MKAGFPGRAQRSKMNVDCVKFQCKEFSLFFISEWNRTELDYPFEN